MTTKEQVNDLLAKGLTQAEISERLQLSKSTVSFHVSSLGKSRSRRPVYTEEFWREVQSLIDQGYTFKQLLDKYGFAKRTYQKAIRKGLIAPRPWVNTLSLDELLFYVDGRKTDSKERKLIKDRLAEERGGESCFKCGIVDWNGEPLSFDLDHIDGNPTRNTRENLRVLCPNCHRQTETWGNRNRSRVV